MKQFYSFFLILALIFGGFSTVYAQENARQFPPIRSIKERPALNLNLREKVEVLRIKADERRAEFDLNKEEVKNEGGFRALLDDRVEGYQDRKVEMQEKRVEFQQDAAEKRITNTARVISATIGRLEKIISRIESRITKLNEDGVETVDATNYIELAKVDLGEAKTSVAGFVSINLTPEDGQANFYVVKEAAKEAKVHIRSAHENLKMAVRSLYVSREDLSSSEEVEELDN